MEVKSLENKIKEKLETIGYELAELSSKFVNGADTVYVVVDRKEPINMEDIVEVTETLNPLFDELVTGNHPYNLDVSSLGLEKPLKVEKLGEYVNSYVHVHLINPINGENIYEGDLKEVSDDSLTLTIRIKTRVKDILVAKENIYSIRLAIKF